MIYLLEDDESIRKLVTYTLQHAGYEAAGLSCPSAFWAAMKRQTPELVLLDIMLPEEDGLSVLKKLRGSALWRELPVVMLTAKNAEYDRVVGLDAGADDYISKPFGMMELLARVRALLRRTGMTSAGEHTVGELYVCRDKHIVRVSGQDVPLTNKEFSLLCLLLEHSGAALTRDRIMDSVWGSGFDGENRTVDVHVRTLRTKLGAAGAYIETVRGVGFRCTPEVGSAPRTESSFCVRGYCSSPRCCSAPPRRMPSRSPSLPGLRRERRYHRTFCGCCRSRSVSPRRVAGP